MESTQRRRTTQMAIDEMISAFDTQEWHQYFHKGDLVDCTHLKCKSAADTLTEPHGK